jgi:hypothetical protein
MPLPSSPNEITVNDVNVELSRTGTTADSGFDQLHNLIDGELPGEGWATKPYSMSELHGFELCFIAGTKVLMGDGRLLDIKDIKVGDLVETIHGVYPVTKLHRSLKHSRSLFSINDDNFFVTGNHPFMTKQGWKCLDLLKNNTKDYVGDTPLQIGDFIQTSTGWVELTKIQKETLPNSNIKLYNFKVENKESYFANNYLVHNKCFAVGTLITMIDETYKPIEEIQVGDTVFTQLGNEEVREIFSPVHDNILEYTFSDGTKTKNTSDHPYYVVDKGWCSNVPELTNERYDIVTDEFVCGDICMDDSDEQIELVNIEKLVGEFQTYTFSTNSKTYYANKILVHSEI